MVDYFKVFDAVFWFASLIALFIISLFHLYYRFYFYLFQCFGSSLGLLVCKITPLGFCSTLLPTLFTPSGKYLFVSTQQIHWSCLVILLKFFFIFDSLHFYPLGVSSPNTPPPAAEKNDFNLNEMKTFMEKAKNNGQKWNCPQHQLRWNQIANQTSQRPKTLLVKLTSRQKMNLSSLGNTDVNKFGNEKWKWTNEWLMWKVKVNT